VIIIHKLFLRATLSNFASKRITSNLWFTATKKHTCMKKITTWTLACIRQTSAKNMNSAVRTQTNSSAVAERPRCRVGKLWPKVKDWNSDTIFTNIIGLYSTYVTYLANKAIKFSEKRKISAIMPFKVICDFLLVINSNYLVPLRSYCSLLFKFWTLRVLSHLLGA